MPKPVASDGPTAATTNRGLSQASMQRWLLGLLALMLLPRLIWLNDARWTGEESWFFDQIVRTAKGLRWSALGTPVSGTRGMHPGPYFYWLLAPFGLTASPKMVAVGVAMIDAIAQLIAVAALRQFWLERPRPEARLALIIAAAVLALSPWTLLYADRPWNSNLVSLPVAMALWGYGAWARGGGLRPFAVLTIGLATLPSFHLSAPLLGLPLLAMVALRWRQLDRRTVLVAAALSVAIWTPYGVHELRSGGANTRGLLERTLPSVGGLDNAALAISWPLRLTSPAIGYHAQRGYWTPFQPMALAKPDSPQGQRWWQLHGDMALPGVLLGTLLAIVAWSLWLMGLRRRTDPMTAVLLVGTALGWALLIVAGRRAYPHYLQPLMPLYAGAFATGLAQIPRRFRRAALAAAALHLATGLLLTQRFYQNNDRPFGLAANLFTADLIEGIGPTQPVFCGDLRYRHAGQLGLVAQHSHPKVALQSASRWLVHARPEAVPQVLNDHSVWRRDAHGVAHLLLVEALPRDLARLGCR